ncbi:MAG: LacI family DNA-binding transcriptional regulator [Syntrophothermus sp.]
MPVTIKDVAKRVGVSHTTVSRALRGNSLISDETSERIRQMARAMGYQPSAAARSLKTNRSQVLGVILSSLDDPFFSEILQGIEDSAHESNFSLFIAASRHDPGREQKIVQTMMEHRVDGVIICSTSFGAEQGRQLLEYGFPTVVVNNQSAENFRYSIYHDDVDGSRQVTRHLIELGHQRTAYLGNSVSGRTTLDRLSGFQQEMEAAGLSIPSEYIHEVPGGGAEHGMTGGDYFLRLPVPPTAIVCFNDLMATGVLKCAHQRRLNIPADLSVTGFDNINFSAYTDPPLTTFDQPKRFIGMEAARLLLGLLHSMPDADEKVTILRGSLLVRSSTAPAPK